MVRWRANPIKDGWQLFDYIKKNHRKNIFFLYEKGGNIYLMFTYTFPYNKLNLKRLGLCRESKTCD